MLSKLFTGRGGKVVSKGLIVLLFALLISQFFAVPSFAASTSTGVPFGLTPSPSSSGQQRSYFQYQIPPGGSASDTVVVSNESASPETLLLSPSSGVTAPNSGTAFQDAFSSCSGTSCWVTGLPSSVTLTPGQSKTLPFTVTVPGGAKPLQYLAGITVKSASGGAATSLGENQKTGAQAVVVREVTTSIVISTANLAQLSSKMTIAGVSGMNFQTLPRLMVKLGNEGQRYANGSGTATCVMSGQKKSFPFAFDTILPGQGATIPINAVGLKSVVNCNVALTYGAAPGASWTGNVTFPVVAHTQQVHVANGVYATIPASHIPVWGIVAIIVGVIVSLLLLAALLVLARRKRTGGGSGRNGSGEFVPAGVGQPLVRGGVEAARRETISSSSKFTSAPPSSNVQ